MSLNGRIFQLHQYEVRWYADAIDTSNFENLVGTEEWTPGIDGAEISFDAVWRTEDNPYTAPMQLTVGTLCGPIIIIPNRSLEPATQWTFTFVIVLESTMRQSVRDVIRYTGRFKNHGTFIAPPVH